MEQSQRFLTTFLPSSTLVAYLTVSHRSKGTLMPGQGSYRFPLPVTIGLTSPSFQSMTYGRALLLSAALTVRFDWNCLQDPVMPIVCNMREHEIAIAEYIMLQLLEVLSPYCGLNGLR
jgi:hypothetical protein